MVEKVPFSNWTLVIPEFLGLLPVWHCCVKKHQTLFWGFCVKCQYSLKVFLCFPTFNHTRCLGVNLRFGNTQGIIGTLQSCFSWASFSHQLKLQGSRSSKLQKKQSKHVNLKNKPINQQGNHMKREMLPFPNRKKTKKTLRICVGFQSFSWKGS